jgi:hypothetical protein
MVAAVLVWRMVTLGMSEYYADRGAAASALIWHASNPQALFEQGRTLASSNPEQADQLFHRAIWEKPTDSRIYMALALLLEEKKDIEQASKLVNTATRLAPRRSRIQLQAGAFWLRQRQLQKALEHWGPALELSPEVRSDFYPTLLRFAEVPEAQFAFKPLLTNPPAWWDDFFRYAAVNAISFETVKLLFHHGHNASDEERRAYMERLQRDGRWQELYFTWLNGLDSQRLEVLGNVYNGSFELPFMEEGFGWYAPPMRGVTIELGSTYGIRGKKALRVTFQGQQVRFQHLYQYLFLDPAHYQLRGQIRLDDLRTERGVQWTLTCAINDQAVLGTTDLFLGTEQWKQVAPQWESFATDFTVPQDCSIQLLRLELAGRTASDFEARGNIWFDDLAIRRLN